jgi:hypothetical protein
VSVTEGLVEPLGFGLAFPDWITVNAPSAGNTASVSVEGAWYVRVVAARCTFSSDGNAANRLVTLDYVNARGQTYVQNGASVVVTASTSGQVFEWDRNRTVAEWNTNTPVWAPLLDEFLPPGFSIKFNVSNIQAGDTLTGLTLWVEKFPTGARGYPQGMVAAPRLATAYDRGR